MTTIKSDQIKQLAYAFLSIKTGHIMVDFLNAILTPTELEEIATRLQIVKMLKKGIPQHDIAQKLGVGIGTVTRGSNEIKRGRFKNV